MDRTSFALCGEKLLHSNSLAHNYRFGQNMERWLTPHHHSLDSTSLAHNWRFGLDMERWLSPLIILWSALLLHTDLAWTWKDDQPPLMILWTPFLWHTITDFGWTWKDDWLPNLSSFSGQNFFCTQLQIWTGHGKMTDPPFIILWSALLLHTITDLAWAWKDDQTPPHHDSLETSLAHNNRFWLDMKRWLTPPIYHHSVDSISFTHNYRFGLDMERLPSQIFFQLLVLFSHLALFMNDTPLLPLY